MELFITGKMFSLLIYKTSDMVPIKYHEKQGHSGEKMEGGSYRKRFLSYGRHPFSCLHIGETHVFSYFLCLTCLQDDK